MSECLLVPVRAIVVVVVVIVFMLYCCDARERVLHDGIQRDFSPAAEAF